MERELEKDLKEIEYLIYVHKERENTHTQSVLERAHEIIETCAKAARTLSELEELLSRENTPEITRSSRDNDGWIPVEREQPEEDGFYIATMDGKIVGQEEPFVGLAEFENGKWIDDEEDYKCVIAWRPMPEVYRPERSNDEK